MWLRPPRQLLVDAVWCGICSQRPWLTTAYESPAEMALVFAAWCHGAFRRWVVGEEIVRLAVYRDDLFIIARALTAFPAMLRALPPVLVAIRRLRGRRLPLPARDHFRVWCLP